MKELKKQKAKKCQRLNPWESGAVLDLLKVPDYPMIHYDNHTNSCEICTCYSSSSKDGERSVRALHEYIDFLKNMKIKS